MLCVYKVNHTLTFIFAHTFSIILIENGHLYRIPSCILLSNFHAAQQLYCPGQNVDLSCEDATIVIWQGSALSGQCPPDNSIRVLTSSAVVGDNNTCGRFTSTVTDVRQGTVPGIFIVTATLTLVANASLNGTTVQCEDIDGNNALEIDQLLDIPGIGYK